MPSSMITADEPGQVYWADYTTCLSVGSSGGIFREPGTSASTMPDSLGAGTSPTRLHHRLYRLKTSTILPDKSTEVIQGDYYSLGKITTRRASP